VLIKDRGLPFQREAFARLGLAVEKLIKVDDDLHVQAETLVVPAVRLDNTRVPKSDLEFSRRLYLPEEPSPQQAHRRLYVGRRDAAFRRVSNENEFMPYLQELGFEEVAMSGLTVAEQARLFSEASLIVGPNGSALANLVFANRACHVVEFFAPGWVVGYNWMIADSIGLGFTGIIGRGPRPPRGTLPSEIKQDIEMDADLLKRVIKELVS
jgi:capsular polysaccharide biosynthesis protein